MLTSASNKKSLQSESYKILNSITAYLDIGDLQDLSEFDPGLDIIWELLHDLL